MNTLKIIVLFLFYTTLSFSQGIATFERDISINEHIDGTVLFPASVENPPLAIIIAGSGPTDRNGNQNFMQNNSLKKLAESLGSEGIASFRYDKRIVKQIRKGNVDENIMFDDFITDAISVLNYFKVLKGFSSVHIIGHSQGSLVGMVAAKEGADSFISLAGAGKPIDMVILDQINKTAPMFTKDAEGVLAILKEGKTTMDYPEALASIFNRDVQPFMSNWMQYDPQKEIKGLTIPILVVNGTKDLQVPITEAELLKNASANAELKIIEKMNHLLVTIEGDDLENSKSYNESHRSISKELIKSLVEHLRMN